MPPRKQAARPVAEAFGVKWFATLKGAQEYAQHRRQGDRLFGVHIRDTPDRFAFYNSFEHFWSVYSDLTRQQRHAWCEHLTGGPCKLYFDVEWVGPDDQHSTQPIVDAIDVAVREVLQQCGAPIDDLLASSTPAYHVLTCHRQQRTGYKYSLHVRYTRVAFADHASLERFVRAAFELLERCEVLRRVEHDTQSVVFIVDKSVYKRSQSLRCPMATKWSTDPYFPVGALGFDRIEDCQGLASPADIFVQAVNTDAPTVAVDALPALPTLAPNARRARQATLDTMFGTRPLSRQRVHDLPPSVDVTQYESNSVRELLVVNGVPVSHTSVFEWQRTAIIADEFLTPVNLPAGKTCVVCKRVHDRDHPLFVVYARRTASVVITCPMSPTARAVFYMVPEIGTWFDDEAVPWSEIHAADIDGILPYCFPPPHTTLLVQAQYGMGKTRALADLIGTLPRDATIIFITNRIKLAQKYAADFASFGVLNYEDNPSPMRPKDGWGFRVATCYNSLHKFSAPYGSRYSLVVLDEISSVLPDTNSRFVANRDSLLFTFGNMIRNADRVIGLDADISYLAYTFMLQLRGAASLHTVCYEYRRPTDRVIYECSSTFDHQILADLAQGRRIVVASMTKSYADEIFAKIEAKYGGDVDYAFAKITSSCPNGHAVRAPGFKASDPTTWRDVNALVYSPSIGAGVSCELDHFDRLYVYVWVSPGTPTCYDVLQMMHRVRSLREGSIFVFFARLPDPQQDEELEAYPTCPADVLVKFERRDTKVFDGLLGRPEPITRPRITSDQLVMPEYTMEFWPTALFVHSLMRAVRSVTHFKPLFYAALLDQRYRREDFHPGVTTEEQLERDKSTALVERMARVDELVDRYPEIGRSVIEHFSKYQDALRHCIDVWEWISTPGTVYERLAQRASIEEASTSPSLARRDAVLDQRSTQWLYALRFLDSQLNLRTGDYVCSVDQWDQLVADAQRYVTQHPRTSVRRAVTHGLPTDGVSCRAVEMYLKNTLRDYGINITSRAKSHVARNAAAGNTVYHASLSSFLALQGYARDHPDQFHAFVYDMCREQIEARRTADQGSVSEAALGEAWLLK